MEKTLSGAIEGPPLYMENPKERPNAGGFSLTRVGAVIRLERDAWFMV